VALAVRQHLGDDKAAQRVAELLVLGLEERARMEKAIRAF